MSEPLLSKEQHTDALAANLPSGRVWRAKHRPDGNLRKLLAGMAPTMRSIDGFLERFVDQVIPPTTEDYLSEWEEALGIPDGCFSVGTTTAARQLAISIKLVVLAGISTEQDFIDLAAIFGLTITAKSGIDHVSVADGGYELATPLIAIGSFTGGVDEARQTLVITESYPEDTTFPWPFSAAASPPPPPVGLKFATSGQNSLRCLIRKLAPANINVIFQENV